MMHIPFSNSILDYLVQKTYDAMPQNARLNTSVQPVGSATPSPLRSFIAHLSRRVNIPILTWMSATVYVDRLKPKLGSIRKLLRCTAHRVFLSILIITAKYLDDSYPINDDWEKHSYMKFNHRHFWLALKDINLIELEMLSLLDWNLAISELDVYQRSEPFFSSVVTTSRAKTS
ncbi:hypothetical protein BKA67DRAFT_327062 [Truncatella angustata]|uniref:Cyclin N-terminal domain-containing protein n=1 Tax=Truncatella angustata TaxID=152316 RepID=A0A9P8ZWF4_9PEZI|nr:uncharacterized protein BKA67DRAFT_327062 [Truncatella angustata]KAH6653640.1 hypothetical protein BKA67DRAFT_327062 [Truncatella angustata]